MSSSFSQLVDEQYISLKTFRKSGEGVLTAVWFAQVDDQLYVTTGPESGKIKRIRHTPQIEIAPCTRVGEVTGEFISAHAKFYRTPKLILHLRR